jgi:hypothetical protein
MHFQAARARCTVGEISDALERAWGRHAASAGVAPGYYVTEREAAATGAVVVSGDTAAHAKALHAWVKRAKRGGASRAKRGGASSCPVQV